jgi:hypothetical protein
MSRLSNTAYLRFRAYLHAVWESRRPAFSLISTADQYDLHQYFRPSEDLTPAEQLEHRRVVSREQPSLPQRAGRALRHFASPKPLHQQWHGRITLYPLLRPQPDLKRLSWALLGGARRQRQQEREHRDTDAA